MEQPYVAERMTWAAREGSITPSGVTWIPADNSYSFALYSKYAERMTVLLYRPDDVIHPTCSYHFDGLKHKTGRIWHARIPKSEMPEARYYAYSIDGPPPSGNRFERHAFNPNKILLDPYAKAVFFPTGFDRAAALGSGSNAGEAPLGVLCECQDEGAFDWGDDPRPHHDGDLII